MSSSPSTSWTPPNGQKAQYNLHCHCRAISYTITLSPPLYTSTPNPSDRCVAVECACSYCARNGLLTVHPLASDVHFDAAGLEFREEYLCGARRAAHWFCRRCGSVLGTDLRGVMRSLGAEERVGINVRMLADFDLNRIATRKLTAMRDAPPKYEG
ncbi:hypothetical protein BDY17DRAFT_324406 [Neohortaea acidophila]|uniref:CENP-V/GFA domain-containing protein n=1 Tax=Neohortaea acidophila TaxID=245834 RepID=A0A6A6PUN7_9PEZI|nr:uncharacterized protein BDY17DRAFT_324406 [Neohortaea acidophila]KAF2483692.1 hypothetical protein BDY17DRAFT_324406 [Neohortaea acidophila]